LLNGERTIIQRNGRDIHQLAIFQSFNHHANLRGTPPPFAGAASRMRKTRDAPNQSKSRGTTWKLSRWKFSSHDRHADDVMCEVEGIRRPIRLSRKISGVFFLRP
ncbi:MAG: hypothetical protein K2X38_00355, partial [Gemmataceae bacterium]|nr:hypothetical protein [Gemmataceae bacterium]